MNIYLRFVVVAEKGGGETHLLYVPPDLFSLVFIFEGLNPSLRVHNKMGAVDQNNINWETQMSECQTGYTSPLRYVFSGFLRTKWTMVKTVRVVVEIAVFLILHYNWVKSLTL